MAPEWIGFVRASHTLPKPVFRRTSPAAHQIVRTTLSSAFRAPQLVNRFILRFGGEIPHSFDNIASAVNLPLAMLPEDRLGDTCMILE